MQKLYCYVDESGQDTEGRLFLVAVVVVAREREEVEKELKAIEGKSGKGLRKWFHTRKKTREAYMSQLVDSKLLGGSIFYATYEESKAYFDLTIFTTAKAIFQKAEELYEATILVDGLRRSERHRFAAGLRRLNVKVRKVRGIRDESDPLIRLADATAGFVRDFLEGEPRARELHQRAVKKGIMKAV